MQVGTTKDQGLYKKPSAAVHPGELAAGTLPQYNTVYIIYVHLVDIFQEFSTRMRGKENLKIVYAFVVLDFKEMD